jgi:predicted secreted protein
METMEPKKRIYSWLRNVIAIAVLGFLLNFPGLGGVRLVGAQAAVPQPKIAGLSWEYQLDFNATSLQSAKQLSSGLDSSLESLGVTSELQSLENSSYRLTLSGDKGMDQVRQAIFSPLLADFIGGPAEIEVDMPVGSLLDTTFKLESNLSTGYGWELMPASGIDFVQVGEANFAARSRGYGMPSMETLVLHPEYMGNGAIRLVYRRPFEPDEAITRYLHITLGGQALEIDLSNPHPMVISTPDDTLLSPNTRNPIDEIPLERALPASWDWRTAGIVPAVRNQGACGGCWSFGTVGVMESAIVKGGGPMTDLSEQFLISCNTSGWSCSGGWTGHKWHYDTLGMNQTTIGAVLEADKPYTASNGTCSLISNHPYVLSGWQFVAGDDYSMATVDQIKNAIYTYGPITAGVCADQGWQSYSGGVYDPSTNECSGYTNHQIILVGWDDATSSWILRNSWGPSWGESGYMRIKWDPTGTKSRVGEGTSWVTWTGAGPAPFSKSSPANGSFKLPADFTLSWGSSSGATSYDVCGDTSNNNICDDGWISTGTDTSLPLSGVEDGTYYWQVRATDGSSTTEANNGTWWSFTVGQGYQVYLPIVSRNYPPIPDTPVLAPINNSAGSNSYSVSWNSAYLATSYVLQEDDNQVFSSPLTRYNGSSTSWTASSKPAGTYYYRVKAHNSWGDSGWSNIQSTTVLPPPSTVYVQNDLSCTLCYELLNTGIGKKCFSPGKYLYGTFPSGTYTYKVTSSCCGNTSGTKTFSGGTYTHRFYCLGSRELAPNGTMLQCELTPDVLFHP